MDVWSLIAERKIQEAMEEGAFENLKGAGEPIREEIYAYEDPAQRMANRLMKNAGVSPAWIVEGRELDTEIQRLRGTDPVADPDGRRRDIVALNRRIALFNLKTPVRSTQKLPVMP